MNQASEKHDVILNKEIIKRIEAMERRDYIFPARFSKRNYIIVAIVAIVCLVIMIIGAII
jgi:hypothetical protein